MVAAGAETTPLSKENINEDTESSSSKSSVPIGPDGGYGWVIVGCSFMCIFTIDGIITTYALLLPELNQSFQTTPALTSMGNSLILGMFLLMGMPTSCLINKYGCRPVAFVGGCIAACGFVASSMANDIWSFLPTFGIIGGVVNTLARLLAGVMTKIPKLTPLCICNVGTFCCAIILFLFSFCTTFWTLCAFAVGLAVFVGFFPPMQPLMVLDYLGLDRLTSAFGLITCAKGPAAIFGPPVAGNLYQLTQSYGVSNAFAGGLFLLSAIVQTLVPFCHKPNTTDRDQELCIDEIEIMNKSEVNDKIEVER